MTEQPFTKERPWVDPATGTRIWRNPSGGVELSDANQRSLFGGPIQGFLRAEDAERTGWQWSNDDHTEARNGRWVVRLVFEKPLIHLLHDDMGDQVLARGDGRRWAHTDAANDTMTDFLVWRAEQGQPEEPTGLGAVVVVGDVRWVRDEAGRPGGRTWYKRGVDEDARWRDLIEGRPVTVLSEGVTS